jgi:hypothetical protein
MLQCYVLRVNVTCKLIKKLRLKQTSNSASPSLIENSIRTRIDKSIKPSVMNTNESYYKNTKILSEQKSRTTNISSHPCQTDV